MSSLRSTVNNSKNKIKIHADFVFCCNSIKNNSWDLKCLLNILT